MYTADAGGSNYSVSLRTKGFKNYQSLYTENPLLNVGVKKETYTITAHTYADKINVSLKFVKVREGKFGSSRKKAPLVKKKSTRNALIITDAKKVHWYKLKNTNGKKMTITIKTIMNGGGNYGGLKITAYKGSKNIGSGKVSADTAKKSFIIRTNLSTKKAGKGTYYLKIQSYNGGNGKFSVRWK